MIIFDGDKVKKTYQKDIKAVRKRAKTEKCGCDLEMTLTLMTILKA